MVEARLRGTGRLLLWSGATVAREAGNATTWRVVRARGRTITHTRRQTQLSARESHAAMHRHTVRRAAKHSRVGLAPRSARGDCLGFRVPPGGWVECSAGTDAWREGAGPPVRRACSVGATYEDGEADGSQPAT